MSKIGHIPPALLQDLLDDPAYIFCRVPGCYQLAEKEHAIQYQGRSLNEKWAIIPCCPDHNRPGRKLCKQMNRHLAYSQATEEDFDKYPKSAAAWRQDKAFLKKVYADLVVESWKFTGEIPDALARQLPNGYNLGSSF